MPPAGRFWDLLSMVFWRTYVPNTSGLGACFAKNKDKVFSRIKFIKFILGVFVIVKDDIWYKVGCHCI